MQVVAAQKIIWAVLKKLLIVAGTIAQIELSQEARKPAWKIEAEVDFYGGRKALAPIIERLMPHGMRLV